MKTENAALCVDDLKQLPSAVENLVKDGQLRTALAKRAEECVRTKHDPGMVRACVLEELRKVAMIQE